MRDTMLIIHFIGLAMGLGTSFAYMFLGIASTKLAPEKAREFQMNTIPLSRMGHIGLALLIISGLFLMDTYWSTLGDRPLLIAKLALVAVLAALIGMASSRAKKAKASGGDMSGVQKIGRLAMLTAIAIVVLAVLVFH